MVWWNPTVAASRGRGCRARTRSARRISCQTTYASARGSQARPPDMLHSAPSRRRAVCRGVRVVHLPAAHETCAPRARICPGRLRPAPHALALLCAPAVTAPASRAPPHAPQATWAAFYGSSGSMGQRNGLVTATALGGQFTRRLPSALTDFNDGRSENPVVTRLAWPSVGHARTRGHAPQAVQIHPSGGQFDFDRSSARVPHGAYV